MVSLNVARRHLTVAQRGLVVVQLYLPLAEKEAAERRAAAGVEHGRVSTKAQVNSLPPTGGKLTDQAEPARGPAASQLAAQWSNGLASARTVERMKDVPKAPDTMAKVRTGEITSARAAQKTALAERGDQTPVPPAPKYPHSVYTHLGQALKSINNANDTLKEGGPLGKVGKDEINTRIIEMHHLLDDTTALLKHARQLHT